MDTGNGSWGIETVGVAPNETLVVSGRFPRAQGLCSVEHPEVDLVLDRATGRYERHCDVIGDDWGSAVQMRLAAQTARSTNPRFLCAMCMTPVYLVSLKEAQKLFFRHTLEDGRCSAVTRGQLSQKEIDARRYNGVKESWLHLEMKKWIVECLRADGRFSEPDVEKRWTGEFSGGWRKPDVFAKFNGIPVAFEIQLSTTYINVIAERRDFYLKEGGLLFWVFADFDFGARRLTQDDVFYNNNRNAFIVNKTTRDASLAQGKFMLDCVWAEPTGASSSGRLQRETVAFDQLQLDQASQRAFYFDFDGERARLAREAHERQASRLEPLRRRFEEWYLAGAKEQKFDVAVWEGLRRDISAEGVWVPAYADKLPRSLLNLLYSTKHGRVIGWSFKSFIQVAHYVEPGKRKHLHYFRLALKAYDRAAQLQAEDTTGHWAAKVTAYKPRLREGDPAFAPDLTNDALVRLLFPEMFGGMA